MYSTSDVLLDQLVVENDLDISKLYEFAGVIPTVEQAELVSIPEFDKPRLAQWRVPPEVLEFNICEFCLKQCTTQIEKERVEEELAVFAEKGLISTLNVLKYIVDTLRANNVVWGVGRGSSVSSFVLFIIGIHKIHSIFYNLDYREFLR